MKAWESMDLAGGGLQAANRRLTRRLKKPHIAYLLWPLFPLGVHAIYLDRPGRAFGYAALSTAAAAFYAATGGSLPATLAPLVAGAGLALYDLFWIPRRVVERNKELRMEVYLSQAPGAPPDFRGRFASEGPAGSGGGGSAPRSGSPQHGPPSFAEQEARLRELAKKHTKT
jgi:hypothetical protein